jgi:alpha-galactosidase
MTTVCFVGAGSVQFTQDLVADILSFGELAETNIRLHDIDEDRLRTAMGVTRSVARQRGAHPLVTTHLDRREALEGADFVINTVEVGGHSAITKDFEIPGSFGVRQTVGDTLGVGGIFRALRTIPFLRSLAEDLADVAPEALLLNYTNPMAMNVGYLSRFAPKLKTYGLCHSVYWTVSDLCDLLGVPLDEVTWASAGVNHQAWMLSLEWRGQSLYPLLDEKIRDDPELLRRVRVDMYRRLGFYPTETSEHSSEYVPWYLPHAEEVERLRIPINRKLKGSEEGLATFAQTKATLSAGDDVLLESSVVEYAPQIIHSIVTGTARSIQVNTLNSGLIPNLPIGSPVEVPATVDREGVHPMQVEALPPQCAALNRSYLNVVDLVIDAALSEEPRAIRHALMVDPNTAASLTVDQVWDMCDALVTAHGDALPSWARAVSTGTAPHEYSINLS